jgi:ectoine hydroxylase-related dioxygenase (phytanoyl-CoA dioxygenase family)
MWALTDFTEETGATRIIPGSNTWDRDPDLTATYETVPMLMPAGSICPFVGSLYHGAGHNRSGRDRVALTINYCSGSMRQQENLMLSVAPQRMMTFPEALQNILGFKMCKGAGHIFGQDPRAEMARHFAATDAHDAYLDTRDALHTERQASPRRRRA